MTEIEISAEGYKRKRKRGKRLRQSDLKGGSTAAYKEVREETSDLNKSL